MKKMRLYRKNDIFIKTASYKDAYISYVDYIDAGGIVAVSPLYCIPDFDKFGKLTEICSYNDSTSINPYIHLVLPCYHKLNTPTLRAALISSDRDTRKYAWGILEPYLPKDINIDELI